MLPPPLARWFVVAPLLGLLLAPLAATPPVAGAADRASDRPADRASDRAAVRAAPTRYLDQTRGLGTDPTGDGTAAVDLRTVEFALDPTLGRGSVDSSLHSTRRHTVFVVLTLGRRVDGSCRGRVEIVVSGGLTNAVVRRPGSTRRPPAVPARGGPDGEFDHEPLLRGLVPTCAFADIEGVGGRVLDHATVPVRAARPPQQRPRLGLEGVAEVPAGEQQRYSINLNRNTFEPLPNVLYGGSVRFLHDDGIDIVPDHVDIDSLEDLVRVEVTVRPGLHPVTAVVRAANATTVRQHVVFYAPGGAVPRPTGTLAGHAFSTQDEAVSFLDDRFAYVGVAPGGRPTCTASDVDPEVLTGCQPYAWNTRSNLLRIGPRLGAVDFAPGTHALRGVYWHGSSYCQDFTYPDAGLTLDGTYSLTTYEYFDIPNLPFDYYRVHFTPAGRFDLVTRPLGDDDRRFVGSYVVGTAGRLDLTVDTPSGPRQAVGTVAVHSDTAGGQFPATGLVLDLDGVFRGAHGSFGGPDYPADVHERAPSAAATWTPARFRGDACVFSENHG